MKLIIFGATGGTGQQIMEQALMRGHRVTAVARKPEAITLAAPNLRVVRGDVMEPATVTNLLADHDVVLSALGTRQGRGPTTLYSTGTQNLLQAMTTHGIRRLVAVTAGAYLHDPSEPRLIRWVVKPILNRVLAEVYADMQRMEALIQCSDTDWTIIRPARLTDGPRTGRYRAVAERPLPSGWQIARADVADYIVTHLDDTTVWRAAISLAT